MKLTQQGDDPTVTVVQSLVLDHYLKYIKTSTPAGGIKKSKFRTEDPVNKQTSRSAHS